MYHEYREPTPLINTPDEQHNPTDKQRRDADQHDRPTYTNQPIEENARKGQQHPTKQWNYHYLNYYCDSFTH
jgi:hypothetical protein